MADKTVPCNCADHAAGVRNLTDDDLLEALVCTEVHLSLLAAELRERRKRIETGVLSTISIPLSATV